MKKVAILLTASLVLMATGAAAGELVNKPADPIGQNIHFADKAGNVQRGVRCAAQERSDLGKAVHNAEVANWLKSNTVPEKATNVSVVFHVVYKTHRGNELGNVPQAWINDQMDVLNAAFSGTGFSFTLSQTLRHSSKKYYTGCYNQDNSMKNAYAVDPANNLNIYSCSPSGGILGYAYLPDSFDESDNRHGVVILDESMPGGSASPYDLGDTATHEVGHYLGLDHTFANGCNNPGDQVADTNYEASARFGCPAGASSCGSSDPIYNFMDYTDDDCMDEFTSDQASRMTSEVAQYKPSL
jgi:hypothetical protein